nr:hypothetical protein [Streptomyces rhizoryzae]
MATGTGVSYRADERFAFCSPFKALAAAAVLHRHPLSHLDRHLTYVADKTGTGDYGRANDVALVWPPHTAPLVIALMSDRPGYTTPPQDHLLAEATTHLVAALTS